MRNYGNLDLADSSMTCKSSNINGEDIIISTKQRTRIFSLDEDPLNSVFLIVLGEEELLCSLWYSNNIRDCVNSIKEGVIRGNEDIIEGLFLLYDYHKYDKKHIIKTFPEFLI